MQGGIAEVAFAGPDRLLAAVRYAGLISLDLASGAARVVVPLPIDQFALGPDGKWGVAIERDRFQPQPGPGRAVRFDLVRGSTEVLEHGDDVIAIALDPGGTLVATSSADRTVRVSRVSGGPPHLLLGAEGAISLGGVLSRQPLAGRVRRRVRHPSLAGARRLEAPAASPAT